MAKPRVAMISPVTAPASGIPESGVGQYLMQLLEQLSGRTEVVVLAQKTAESERHESLTVRPTWRLGVRGAIDVAKTLRRSKSDVIHLQHEFNLFGGVPATMLITGFLAFARARKQPVVTTLHGIVRSDDVTNEFLARSYLPRHERIARIAFRAAYKLIDAASSMIIVHHEYFAKALSDDYGVDPRKIRVVPFGVDQETTVAPIMADSSRHQRTALIFGFLTGYKLPEVVVDLAESDLIPDWRFRFCVGKNPRLNSNSYHDRYKALRERVERLDQSRATWSGYLPDDELPALFSDADVLILPYTECLSGSAVANLAKYHGVAVCYSEQLEPVFGNSRAIFSLGESGSLVDAISFAARTRGRGDNNYPTWADACRRTEEIWAEVLERDADRFNRS